MEQRTGSTALALAAMQGSYKGTELLVQARADIHAADQMGLTPVMGAAVKGHTRIAKLLVRLGARSVARVGEHVTRLKRVDLDDGGSMSTAAWTSDMSSGSAETPGVWGLQRRHLPHASASSRDSQRSSRASYETATRPADEEEAAARAAELIAEEEAEARKSGAAKAAPRCPRRTSRNKQGRAKTK